MNEKSILQRLDTMLERYATKEEFKAFRSDQATVQDRLARLLERHEQEFIMSNDRTKHLEGAAGKNAGAIRDLKKRIDRLRSI